MSDPEPIPERWCNGRGTLPANHAPATRVCADASGLAWFACDDNDHAPDAVRTMPIAAWFRHYVGAYKP